MLFFIGRPRVTGPLIGVVRLRWTSKDIVWRLAGMLPSHKIQRSIQIIAAADVPMGSKETCRYRGGVSQSRFQVPESIYRSSERAVQPTGVCPRSQCRAQMSSRQESQSRFESQSRLKKKLETGTTRSWWWSRETKLGKGKFPLGSRNRDRSEGRNDIYPVRGCTRRHYIYYSTLRHRSFLL